MSASSPPPAPPPGAAAPPGPAGFADLFEQSLHALVKPAATFRAAAARPAPSFAASTSLALVDGLVAIAINLAHTAIANPRFLERYSPRVVAVMSAAALGVYTSVWLLAAVGLYAVGRLLGGRGEFDRGLQGAAALTVLAPLLAVCNPLPFGCWLAPAALLGWVAYGALEGLFAAPAAPARVLGGLLAAAGVAGLAGVRAISDRAPEIESAALLATQTAELNSELSRGIQTLPAAAPADSGAGGAPASAPMPTSGLDLLRAPDDVAGGAAPMTVAAASAQGATLQSQAQGVQRSAVGMLDALAPMLDNPAAIRRLTPAQRVEYHQLTAMIKRLRDDLAAGKPIPPAQMNQQMMEIQKLAFALMMAQAVNQQTAAPAPSAAPGAAPVPRLKPMDGDNP